jgi:hypothetical protein
MSEYEQIGRYAVHGDGLVGNPADTALVYADGSARQVVVRASRYATVWGHVWTSGATDIILSVGANASGSTRTDLVVLELTRSSGVINVKVIAGTPGAGAPAITSNSSIHQLGLATVTVTNGASVITAGQVSMVALPQRPVLVQTYFNSATWTMPVGARIVTVEVQGAGGGSGGVAATAGGESALSGGGGGGGYTRRAFDASELAATVTVTVGIPGTAGAAGQNDGGTGGSCSFGTHMSATGGAGGAGGDNTSGNLLTAGGAGGTGTGGNMNIPGGAASNSMIVGGVAIRTGLPGRAYLSGQTAVTTSATGAAGSTGANYGGGGSPAFNGGSQATRAGGAGGLGVVVVTTYF